MEKSNFLESIKIYLVRMQTAGNAIFVNGTAPLRIARFATISFFSSKH